METARDESSDDDDVVFSDGSYKFSEVCDPIAAMMWISRMEDVFELIKCADNDKVRHGFSVLTSEARDQWITAKNMSGPETLTKMTWSRFKEVFRNAFYPTYVERGLVEQYRTLKQERNESVDEYAGRFMKLWWFFWCHLTHEKRMIYLFVCGLKSDIKVFTLTSGWTTYAETVEAARVIEMRNNRQLEERNDLKRKRERRMCTNCGKSHEGECRHGSKGCYRCGKLGHLARECRSI